MMNQLDDVNYKDLQVEIEKIQKIWEDIGLNENKITKRRDQVWQHIHKLVDDIFIEETTLFNNYVSQIRSYELKIQELAAALKVQTTEFNGPLLQKLENLENELTILEEKKSFRLKLYGEWKNEERKLCQLLNFSQHSFAVRTIPNQEDLDELKQHITMLETEVKHRRKKIKLMKSELSKIQEVTEYVPESDIEKEVIFQPEITSLSNETFEILEQVIAKAQNLKGELENQKKDLIEKLTVLWERLKIEENYRSNFLQQHPDCKMSTIQAFQLELDRCQTIKKKNIKQLVESVRRELFTLWNKCDVSESERQLFQHCETLDCTDEVLESYEKEFEKWKKYYEDVKSILEKIEKRKRLFDLMIEFENKANDPNRFKNRKGNLLKEEKDRKKVQRDLPALETEILADIANFETKHGKRFLYDGGDFRVLVTNQWADRKAQKENNKILRQKQHLLNLQHEVSVGTPAKRHMASSPKSAPSKLFKANPCSSLHPPTVKNTKKPPCTISKMAGLCSYLPGSRPNVNKKFQRNHKVALREINHLQAASATPNATTYADFAKELNKTARCGSHSSLLRTIKPGGMGIRYIRSRKFSSGRKSNSKSLRRSNKNVSKLTPTRTNSVLPILK